MEKPADRRHALLGPEGVHWIDLKGSPERQRARHQRDTKDQDRDAERELRRGNVPFSAKVIATKEQFIQGLEAFEPDLILSDCRLPGFDGLSALSIAREKLPEVPFIFFSGTLDDKVAAESLQRGATDYVLKQRLSRLAPSVRRALRDAEDKTERRRVEQALRESEDRFRLLVETVKDYMVIQRYRRTQ